MTQQYSHSIVVYLGKEEVEESVHGWLESTSPFSPTIHMMRIEDAGAAIREAYTEGGGGRRGGGGGGGGGERSFY